jgi:hypothetical protein
MIKQLRNKWGYIPTAAGFILIAIGVAILVTHVVLNEELATPNGYFWFYWAPIITTLLFAGAISTVTGLLINTKIENILSYASVAGGFLLIIFDSYFLIGDWARDYEGYIGISSFFELQSGGVAVWFFSWLMAGIFLVVFGIVLGLRVRSRLGISSIAAGSVLLLLAFCLITMDVITTAAIDPVFGLSEFRWHFFWENFTPVIPISLVIGGVLVFSGALLMRKRNQIIA